MTDLHPPRQERCDTCRYWESYSSDPDHVEKYPNSKDAGHCRRFPPQLMADAERSEEVDDTTSAWTGWFPETQNYEWCGEWAPERSTPVAVPS